ncbi:hypothetical protein ACO0K3_10690 [Undibacterium sp. Rencai35W]|uniref:hypothetical protein n=1 Tax=Undibacterium sp. Rencai35W TaxID=3413046 RepID=UPI003BF45D4F
MAKTLRRTYLDFKGLCQLTWVGRLVSVPGPKENIVVRAYFTEILTSSQNNTKPKRFGEAFWKDVPIGDILDMPIGTLFFQGVPVKQYEDEAFSLRKGMLALNFTDDNVKIIDRWTCVDSTDDSSPAEKLLLPRAPSSLPNDSNYRGTLLYIGAYGDPFAYAIPSYEVFRFFYAVSSRMSDVFLDSRFLEWGRFVWNPERSSIDFERKEALLWLRQWMLDQDAWFIASIAFDPISVKRGMDLYRSIAVDQNRILRAVPPMHDWVNIKAKWVSIKNGLGTTTKVILQILSTDWHPPFNKLRFDRDNDGRKGSNEDGNTKDPLNRPAAPFTKPNPHEDENEFIDLTDLPSNPGFTSEIISMEEINDRFEWLISAEVDKLPQLETQFEGEKYQALLHDRWTGLLSTMDGTSSASAIQSVILTTEDLELLSNTEFEDDELHESDEPIHTPNNDLLTIAQGLVNIRDKTNANVEFMSLWGPPILIETFELYRLPRKIRHETFSWLYKAKSKKARLALAAKITRPNDSPQGFETRFILDFEPNPKNSNIVVVWTESSRELTAYDLRRLIRGFAQARSVMKDQSCISDLQMGYRKHTIPPGSLRNGIDFLDRIFSTEVD